MNKRVFVTGLGAITASGRNVEELWDNILLGKSAIAPLTQANLTGWDATLGAEVPSLKPQELLMDRKLIKAVAKHDVFGIHAAMQAVAHSNLISYRDELQDPKQFNDETAVYVGSPGNKYYQQYDFLPLLAKTDGCLQKFGQQLFNEVHPMWLLRILPNNVLAYTGITYGFKGPNHNITNHAAGGMLALLEAYHAIQSGRVERVLVVAYDWATEPQALYYYDQLGLISHNALRPFDLNHDGTILGDGACALVLESEASVNARQAQCYAEILGGFTHTEGVGLFAIQDDGASLIDLLRQTQAIVPDLDIIVAHGNGNPKSDLTEAHAITNVFNNTPTTAFKWAMGHTVCTSGALDTLLATQMLQTKIVPGIANLTTIAQECATLNISQTARKLKSAMCHALIINRGFAGINTCLALKSCE